MDNSFCSPLGDPPGGVRSHPEVLAATRPRPDRHRVLLPRSTFRAVRIGRGDREASWRLGMRTCWKRTSSPASALASPPGMRPWCLHAAICPSLQRQSAVPLVCTRGRWPMRLRRASRLGCYQGPWTTTFCPRQSGPCPPRRGPFRVRPAISTQLPLPRHPLSYHPAEPAPPGPLSRPRRPWIRASRLHVYTLAHDT